MKKTRILSLCAKDSVFARGIANELGIKLTGVNSITFSKGEVKSYPLETVRGSNSFIISQYHNEESVNDQLMRILILSDSLVRASAEKIILVIPCLPYMRQDYRSRHREPISARLLADLFKTAGINHIVTFDLHGKTAEGFFKKIDSPGFTTILSSFLTNSIQFDFTNLIISTGDVGGTNRVKKLAEKLNLNFTVVYKTRNRNGGVDKMVLLGEVYDKDVLIFDDITDSGDTLIKATETLMLKGARSVSVAVTHLFNDPLLIEKLEKSIIAKIFTSDSIYHNKLPEKFMEISLIEKTTEMIKNITEGSSMDLT